MYRGVLDIGMKCFLTGIYININRIFQERVILMLEVQMCYKICMFLPLYQHMITIYCDMMLA